MDSAASNVETSLEARTHAEPEPTSAEVLINWATWDQPSHLPKGRILSDGWDTKGFSKAVASSWLLPSPLTAVQASNLMRGFMPMEMEDRWFIYTSGPDAKGKVIVHFYRSWTGLKFSQLEVQLIKGGGGEVTKLIWESDPEVVGDQDQEGAKMTTFALCRSCLEVELPGMNAE